MPGQAAGVDATRSRLTELKGCFSLWDWSPDGSSLLTFQPGLTKEVELMKISTGERKVVLSHRITNLFGARFSPTAVDCRRRRSGGRSFASLCRAIAEPAGAGTGVDCGGPGE
jgi:hypothetical protein